MVRNFSESLGCFEERASSHRSGHRCLNHVMLSPLLPPRTMFRGEMKIGILQWKMLGGNEAGPH